MLIPPLSDFGYYSVNNSHYQLYTENKFEAIDIASKTNSRINWHFHDALFSSYNWTVEPTETLDELYAQRAQQLREKYDFLVLMYSGGYDSHNILLTFLNHNIPLDEVCSFYSEYDYLKDSVVNQEWELQTKPRLCSTLGNLSTKIRRLDLSKSIINVLSNVSDQYIYSKHSNLAPHYRALDNIYTEVNEWSKIVLSGKKIGLIFGIDKPRLRVSNNHWIYNFYDLPLLPKAVDPVRSEWFYWSADAPLIPIKQAHVVKKYWSQHSEIIQANTYNNNLGYLLDINKNVVQQLVYPHCEKTPFLKFSTLNSEAITGNRDRWVYQSNNEHAYKWNKLYQHLKRASNLTYYNNQTFSQGFVLNISKDYIIE